MISGSAHSMLQGSRQRTARLASRSVALMKTPHTSHTAGNSWSVISQLHGECKAAGLQMATAADYMQSLLCQAVCWAGRPDC